jgi:hypothetical protein
MASQALTLFGIGDEIAKLESLLIQSGGEITEVDQERQIDEWLNQLATMGEHRITKLDNYVVLIRELEMLAAVRDEEAARMKKLASIPKKKAEFLKERLRLFFQFHEIAKTETTRATISLVGVGGIRKLTILIPPNQLPKRYQTLLTVIKTTVDKTQIVLSVEANTDLIRAELEAGAYLDFAMLEPRGNRLSIK